MNVGSSACALACIRAHARARACARASDGPRALAIASAGARLVLILMLAFSILNAGVLRRIPLGGVLYAHL